MGANRKVDFISQPVSAPLTGRLRVPGDKSISHRALMLGSIAEGDTHISGLLESEDTIATLNIFRSMGVRIEQSGKGELLIHGVGLDGLKPPGQVLDFGNSGTSVRLLSGILAGQSFDCELVGDASLMTRPMRRITDPLQQMGADIICTEQGTLPIQVRAGRRLKGINYVMPVASAQIKSALLLAGLYAEGKTCVGEPAMTRDHTERMLRHFSCPVENNAGHICLTSHTLTASKVNVPADISSAAFFMVAASIVKDSDLILENVGINPTRHAVIEILKRMGADISLIKTNEEGAEPTADIRVRASRLHGIDIPHELVPIAIDEFPVIFIAAAVAQGDTVLRGAAELRVKESDRIEAMRAGLEQLGVDVQVYEDGMRVRGGSLHAAEVQSYTDHRIAMAFSVAGLVCDGGIRVHDCINVDTSFPGFVSLANSVGMSIKVV